MKQGAQTLCHVYGIAVSDKDLVTVYILINASGALQF